MQLNEYNNVGNIKQRRKYMNWEQIWNSIVNFFSSNIWNIVSFLLVFFFGLLAVKILINIVRRVFAKTKMEKITQNFLMAFIKLALYLIWVLILLGMLGIQVTGIITALSALLLAIGMALESNIANLANGIVIISTHLFKKGDYISVAGVEGSVVDINFLFTTIFTTDNKKITLPNSSIVNGSLVNYGANKTRRVDFTFSVAYESDVEKVKEIVLAVMHSDGRVLLEPNAPFCRLKTLSASSIDFFANCWCDSEDYWSVYYYVIENVYNEFKRNKISVPYNQLEVRNRNDKVVMPVVGKKLPERVEKERTELKQKFNLETDGLDYFLHKRLHNTKKKEEKAEKKAKKIKDEKSKNLDKVSDEKVGEVEIKQADAKKNKEKK